MVSSGAKYYALIGLGALIAGLTYLVGQPQVTEGVILTTVLVGATVAFHDLESNGTT